MNEKDHQVSGPGCDFASFVDQMSRMQQKLSLFQHDALVQIGQVCSAARVVRRGAHHQVHRHCCVNMDDTRQIESA